MGVACRQPLPLIVAGDRETHRPLRFGLSPIGRQNLIHLIRSIRATNKITVQDPEDTFWAGSGHHTPSHTPPLLQSTNTQSYRKRQEPWQLRGGVLWEGWCTVGGVVYCERGGVL